MTLAHGARNRAMHEGQPTLHLPLTHVAFALTTAMTIFELGDVA